VKAEKKPSKIIKKFKLRNRGVAIRYSGMTPNARTPYYDQKELKEVSRSAGVTIRFKEASTLAGGGLGENVLRSRLYMTIRRPWGGQLDAIQYGREERAWDGGPSQ